MSPLRRSPRYPFFQFVLIMILSAISLHAQSSYNFQTIDFPGGSSTQARGINQQGDVVGLYADPSTGLFHGFRLSGKVFSKIDFPGATQTYPRGINATGNIVGFFADSSGIFHGFLLSSAGYRQIDVPGAFSTTARAITDNGMIVGDYSPDNVTIACYVLNGGSFSTFSFPGETLNTCTGISRRGDVLGYYTTTDDFSFVRRLGRFTPIGVPGAIFQDPLGMNDLDQVVGLYSDSNGVQHGYMADIALVTNVDPPGASLSTARGINGNGVIVGNYSIAGVGHGFIATPVP